MGLKTIIPVHREATTTDGTTYVELATFAFDANCSFALDEIFVLGKTTNGTIGQTAYCKATHRGRLTAVEGLVLIGAPIYIVTFATGSDSPLATCSIIFVVSQAGFGAKPFVSMQVRGVAGRNISWYGGFTIIRN